VRYTLKHVENAMKAEGMLNDVWTIRIGLSRSKAKCMCHTTGFI
jgi:hypothetical protein